MPRKRSTEARRRQQYNAKKRARRSVPLPTVPSPVEPDPRVVETDPQAIYQAERAAYLKRKSARAAVEQPRIDAILARADAVIAGRHMRPIRVKRDPANALIEALEGTNRDAGRP